MSQGFRFHIAKYQDDGIHICPMCGRRSFTYYVSRKGRRVNDEARGIYYGICSHRNSCGYVNYPNGVPDPDTDENYKASDIEARELERPKVEPVFYDMSLVRSTGKPHASSLIQYLSGRQVPNLDYQLQNYMIGATRDGGTIFWSIDHQNRVHRGKIMYYQPDGHRVKDDKGNGKVNSVRVKMMRPKDIEPPHCYFGEHLIPQNPDKVIGIVESEKTALICSCFFPQQIWIATGSKNNLHSQYCEAIKGRKVVVYPDYDAFDEWARKMEFIGKALSVDYSMDDTILESGNNKQDLADLLLQTLP